MAIDMFLDIDNKKIRGECNDKAYSESIQVLTWTWTASRTVSGRVDPYAGRVRGAVAFSDLSFTKYVDSASPQLLEAFANAAVFKKARLILRKSGGKPLDYMTYTMESVLVSSIGSGVADCDKRQTETVTLNFIRLTTSYQAQGADGDKSGGIVEAVIRSQAPG